VSSKLIQKEIDVLEARREELDGQIDALELSKRAAVAQEFGLVPNETIIISRKKEYLVLGVTRAWDGTQPWLKVRQRLANGSWSTHPRELYHEWVIKP
jgi:hypothetical protein